MPVYFDRPLGVCICRSFDSLAINSPIRVVFVHSLDVWLNRLIVSSHGACNGLTKLVGCTNIRITLPNHNSF